jgi:K+-transporting ATPase ATPase C chain
MFKQLGPAFRMMILFTAVTGLIYPGIVFGISQLLFPSQANGSLQYRDGHVVGSMLLGQNFTAPMYFHPRPSNAGNNGYDATASGAFNYGPTNQKLYDRVKASAIQFRKENPEFRGEIPADALTASGSGLDPDISVANALAQSARVSTARGASIKDVSQLIAAFTQGRDLGFLGEPRVNVLALNMALDQRFPKAK